MAIKQPKPQPEYKLSHRLTGTVIIVTLAVVIIPILLHLPSTESGLQSSDDSDTITEQGSLTESQEPILKNEPLVTGSDKAQSQPDDSASSATSSATSESDQPKQNDSSSGQQAAVVMTADTDQQTGQPWIVRVGTYAKIENVNSISKLLADNGFEAQHTEVQTSLGKAVRVWTGPYYGRELAEKASLQLKTLTNEKVYVTRQTP